MFWGVEKNNIEMNVPKFHSNGLSSSDSMEFELKLLPTLDTDTADKTIWRNK